MRGEALDEIIKGIIGDSDLSKYIPIIIIGVLIVAIYLLSKKDTGILGMLKDFPIAGLLGGGD